MSKNEVMGYGLRDNGENNYFEIGMTSRRVPEMATQTSVHLKIQEGPGIDGPFKRYHFDPPTAYQLAKLFEECAEAAESRGGTKFNQFELLKPTAAPEPLSSLNPLSPGVRLPNGDELEVVQTDARLRLVNSTCADLYFSLDLMNAKKLADRIYAILDERAAGANG